MEFEPNTYTVKIQALKDSGLVLSVPKAQRERDQRLIKKHVIIHYSSTMELKL